MNVCDDIVYGERIGALLPDLFAVRGSMTIGRDRMCHFSVTLEPEMGQPLRRAMMRVEADLLHEDVGRVGSAGEVDRTDEQRSADALVR